jgi:transcriptional regulator with XRE-family HTH domain
MSQDMLADLTGINRVNLSRIENGKAMPGLKTIADLAKALGITPSELLDGIS